MKLTPVLFVEAIERSLPFWIERLGFAKTVDVPEGDRLAFVILQKGAAEVMLQTRSSAAADVGAHAAALDAKVSLFVEVDDFAAARRSIEGVPVTMPERVTFYGMREIGVQEPGGHYVTLAARETGA